ncbi:MAG: hypothetical protein Q8Q37_02805 [bacterium]|nr:hypothetical protein [bacterium]
MSGYIKDILDYAIWAPSGDNSQPWAFQIGGDSLLIYNLPDKDNPYLNFEQSGSYIAHGGLIENMVIAASHFGYSSKVDLFPSATDKNLVAEVFFSKSDSVRQDALFEFIKKRHTNRRPYKNIPLTAEQRSGILRASQESESGGIKLLESEKEKQIAGKAGALAEIVILENKKLHGLLFKDVVWNESREKRLRHGLYINAMEFNPVQKIMFRLAKNWPLMKLAIHLGLPRFIAKEDSKLYASGSAMGIITMSGNNSRDYVNAGRLMQRVWLKATSFGLVLQPVTATLFFAQRIISEKTENLLSSYHISLMKSAYDDIKRTFDVGNETIAMMFRLGEAGPASSFSSRISVEEKLISKLNNKNHHAGIGKQ